MPERFKMKFTSCITVAVMFLALACKNEVSSELHEGAGTEQSADIKMAIAAADKDAEGKQNVKISVAVPKAEYKLVQLCTEVANLCETIDLSEDSTDARKTPEEKSGRLIFKFGKTGIELASLHGELITVTLTGNNDAVSSRAFRAKDQSKDLPDSDQGENNQQQNNDQNPDSESTPVGLEFDTTTQATNDYALALFEAYLKGPNSGFQPTQAETPLNWTEKNKYIGKVAKAKNVGAMQGVTLSGSTGVSMKVSLDLYGREVVMQFECKQTNDGNIMSTYSAYFDANFGTASISLLKGQLIDISYKVIDSNQIIFVHDLKNCDFTY